MKKEVKKLLQELKDKKIPVSKIEKDLNIPSGLLWKVKEGLKTINQERMDQLLDYYKKNTGAIFIKGFKVETFKITVKKIKPQKEWDDKMNCTIIPKTNTMPKGLSLSDQLKWRIENG